MSEHAVVDSAAAPTPVLAAPHISLMATSSEVLVVFGQTRILMSADKDGHPIPVQAIEWVQTVSMPPNTALALRDALSAGIEHYEKTFGKIPTDPAAQIKTSQGVTGNP